MELEEAQNKLTLYRYSFFISFSSPSPRCYRSFIETRVKDTHKDNPRSIKIEEKSKLK